MSDDPVKKISAELDRLVGYKRPPVSIATRWKPGQSGNPNGRTKAKSLGEIFRKLAALEVITVDDGERVADCGIELIIRNVFSRAATKTDLEAARMILSLAREYLPRDRGPEPETIEAPEVICAPVIDASAKN